MLMHQLLRDGAERAPDKIALRWVDRDRDLIERVMAGELLDLPHQVAGIALNLEHDKVGAILFGAYEKIKEGD